VYDLSCAYFYHFDPPDLNKRNSCDRAQVAYIFYAIPVPGAKRYFVDPSSAEGTLQPLNTEKQLQSVPPQQIVWGVSFQDEEGKAVRKLLRAYFKSLSRFDDFD
jgi:hypothetical protein